MKRECRLIGSRVVAITDTHVEENLVTIDPERCVYANPRYQVAILIELADVDEQSQHQAYLLFNGLLFLLSGEDDPTPANSQTFKFELVDDITPQVERIINLAVDKAL